MALKVTLLTASALSLSVLASACSSSPSDTGIDPGTTAVEDRNVNPDGVPYPTKGIGVAAQKVDKAGKVVAPGSVIENFKFLGYPNEGVTLNPKGTLKTLALADYYDPEAKRIKLIHLVVGSVWCGPCNKETDALVAAYPTLHPKGLVVVQGLADGPDQGKGATKLDLDGWVDDHKTTFPQFLDPQVKNLGVFFNAAAVPWNAYIDPRSMEILYASVGGVDPTEYGNKYLAWVNANPATTF